MTNDYDKLRAMKACEPALHWIGDRTIEQAWSDCERSDWMCWLLDRISPWDQRLLLAFASRTDESAAQADILRQYFSAREVGDLFRRAGW